MVAEGKHPPEGAANGHGGQFLTSSGPQCGASVEQKGDVGAELGCEAVELLEAQPGFPQLIAGNEGGGGVGGSSGHATRNGDALVDPDVGTGTLGSAGLSQ